MNSSELLDVAATIATDTDPAAPVSQWRVMLDSISPDLIPRGQSQLIAGYVDGGYQWPADGWARFPAQEPVRITVEPWTGPDRIPTGYPNGDWRQASVIDVE